MKEKTKVIRINGIKTTVVILPKVNPKNVPDEINSEKNHPKGLVVTL